MRRKKIMASALVVTMASATMLSGCGNKGNSNGNVQSASDTTAKSTDKKDSKQELTFAASPGSQINPGVTTTDTEWSPEGYVHEGLVRNSKGEDGYDAAKEGVAEKWEVSEDKLTYTFYIRENAKWADGKPVTAEDFVYSWRRLVDPSSDCTKNSGLLSGVVKNAKEVQEGTKKLEELGVKADGNKFIVTLEKPCLYFLEYCFHPVLKPVREDYVKKYGKEMGKTVESIMGNGAYTCTYFEAKNKIIFEKSETYWNKDTRDIKKITFNAMKDDNAIFSAFSEGQLDRAGFADSDYIERAKEMEHVANISKCKNDIEFLMFNCKNEYLSNVNIRKALCKGFSREAYIDDIENGIGEPAYNMVPPTILCGGKKYTPGDFKAELEKMDAKALLKQGLKELGKTDDPSQIELRILTRGTRQADKDVVEFFMEEFKNTLGITIKADIVDYTIAYDKMDKHDFDIAFGGWFADWNDPSNFLDNFISGNNYSEYGGYSNKQVDDLLTQGHEATDADAATKLYAEAEKIICIDEPAMIPFRFAYSNVFAWDYIKGYETRPNLGFEDFEGVYVSGKEGLK